MITPFEIFDLCFLAVLLVLLLFFLSKNKNKLSKEGILYLYKTKWGINLINKIGEKYKKTLGFLSYVSIIVGFLLMVGIIYLFGNTLFQYLTNPAIVETIRAPPIAPLIPYFPVLFGLSDFFPPLYAIYFILAVLIVATIHEFSHGIFARRWNIKIKTTGFAFLKFFPAIFGAFVEQDEKSMMKSKRFQQMSVLAAGVFANVIMALVFFILLILFFNIAFSPSGVYFNSYTASAVNYSDLAFIGGIGIANNSLNNILNSFNDTEKINVQTHSEQNLIGTKEIILSQENNSILILYENAPAVNSGLKGIIKSMDGTEVTSLDKLKEELSKKSPGQIINIQTLYEGQNLKYNITLGKNPFDSERAYLGIASPSEGGWLATELTHFMNSFRPANMRIKGNTYYEPQWGAASEFIYYLLWWIVLINFLIALFNMLPVGILDGGRFFYLMVFSLTKSEKASKKIYGFLQFLILLVFVLLMVRWALSFI